MSSTVMLALEDTHAVWGVALGLGLVVALVVTALLILLLSFVKDIELSVGVLLETAGALSQQTEYIPQLTALPPVLDQVIEEALVQDGYMNALTDGYGVPA
ncbi:MAG: hypothetical protein M3296_05915 [Actinomycetota bacterium]|nr:hypothetical protein [Actinomycetota bacterium]